MVYNPQPNPPITKHLGILHGIATVGSPSTALCVPPTGNTSFQRQLLFSSLFSTCWWEPLNALILQETYCKSPQKLLTIHTAPRCSSSRVNHFWEPNMAGHLTCVFNMKQKGIFLVYRTFVDQHSQSSWMIRWWNRQSLVVDRICWWHPSFSLNHALSWFNQHVSSWDHHSSLLQIYRISIPRAPAPSAHPLRCRPCSLPPPDGAEASVGAAKFYGWLNGSLM